MFRIVNPSEPSDHTMTTPASVATAVATPTFYQNSAQFWNMIDYLFTEHGSVCVWQHLSPLTMHQVSFQTLQAIEAASSYDTLQSRKTQLHQLYFAILQKTKGGKSHSRFLYDESPEFLQSVYRIYKLLRQLNFQMPLFGQTS